MTYHFRIHKERNKLWAECVELEGCITQGKDRRELEGNMREALNLYLEEPENSKANFAEPMKKLFGPDVVPLEVEPTIAFAMQLRQIRMRNRLTQKEAARRLGMRSLFSYQRLERRSNPSLATMRKIKTIFPEFSLDSVLGD